LIVDASYSLHALNDELSVKLYGTRGGAEIEPSLSIVTEKHDTIVNVTPQIDHPEFDFEGAFRNEIDHFVKSCRGEAETLSPVEDGVELMKILCGIYESSAKGAEIRFD
jgi:predicted dehydrogenase